MGKKRTNVRVAESKAIPQSAYYEKVVSLPEQSAPPEGLTQRRISSFGWRPDIPDPRDQLFSVAGAVLQALPSAVDLRSQDSAIYDQGRIGSCTANAIAGAIEFDRHKLGQTPDFIPSRLFIYYNERSIEGSIANDAGAMIRDGIKSVNKLGACPETDWPYDDTPAAYEGGPFPPGAKPAMRPLLSAYNDAKTYQVISYQKLASALSQLKGVLAQGLPFVFGFPVFENLYDSQGKPQTTFPLPDGSKQIGGHAVMAIGYLDGRQQFIIRNSWGTSLGDKGYFYLPYAYVTSYASDFWVIRGVSH